eukprot:5314481-Amphidinium_carterae.1
MTVACQVASLKFVFECLANGEAHFTKEKLADLLYRVLPSLDQDRLEDNCCKAHDQARAPQISQKITVKTKTSSKRVFQQKNKNR